MGGARRRDTRSLTYRKLRSATARAGSPLEWGPTPRIVALGDTMSLEKVDLRLLHLLAATLNFGFFIGDIADPSLHNIYELFAAVIVNLIATVLKFGDRTQIGAVHLATSLVAGPAAHRCGGRVGVRGACVGRGLTREMMASIVSLSGGALFANVVSVVLLVIETVSFHRR